MHSGVATRAARGGWPDGWLVAKGLRRGAAVVVPCGFGSPKEGSSQSTRDHPVRDTFIVTVVSTPSLEPCEKHFLPPPIERVRDTARADEKDAKGNLGGHPVRDPIQLYIDVTRKDVPESLAA
ncbi:hypothetical protein X777_02846 [Ooceraea biroi]|uniref:Uncharacterized protein n=1 Tax=Ooceraea biroi TaxID=2015173 RepID=A0A026WJT9_OOCBI|nr:hypothetical protein X777_02846 [Ooceraea biroi]